MALSRMWHDDPFMSLARAVRDPFDTFLPSALSRDVLGGEAQGMGGLMKLDVKETDKSYDVTADLPGVNKDDIKVEFDEHLLRISAERREEKKQETERYFVSERRYGSTSRTVRLPNDAASDGISAKYENGVLRVCVPKSQKSETQRAIKVD